MGKNYFNEEEIKELMKNQYVKNITTKSISFTKEFKEIFVEETKNGKGPIRIFIEHGLTPYILGSKRIDRFSTRIKKKMKNNETLEDNRGKNATGRPKKIKDIFVSKDEEIEFLKHQNLMLKAENDLLKKMEFLVNQKKLKNLQQEKDIN